MSVLPLVVRAAISLVAVIVWSKVQAADTFSAASYNLENYLDSPSGGRPAKSETSKARVREALRVLDADILALQEVGNQNALAELRSSLHTDGIDYGHWEFVTGVDTNIHVAILSKFPIVARRSHTNESFLLNGRRFRISRGIAEVDIRVSTRRQVTLFAAHLKSKRESPEADQADLRQREAGILRRLIDERFDADPTADLLVMGDFNDTKNSAALKLLVGRGTRALFDTRPAERNGDPPPNWNPRLPPRNVAWTHYYALQETYSRIDYILASPHLARKWDPAGTYVLALANWGVGSDHRPLIARFSIDNP